MQPDLCFAITLPIKKKVKLTKSLLEYSGSQQLRQLMEVEVDVAWVDMLGTYPSVSTGNGLEESQQIAKFVNAQVSQKKNYELFMYFIAFK